MRADAKRNYDHLLAVAREAVVEHGAEASLREIARRAGMGLATFFRHFPTREALLDTLLRTHLNALTEQASELETADDPGAAMRSWFRDGVAFTRTFGKVVDMMAAALGDPDSALHASCSQVRSAGARLLERAQAAGAVRTDIDGTDLFALMGGLGWAAEQDAFAIRADHLTDVIVGAVLAPSAKQGRLPADRPTERSATATEV